MLPPSPVAWRQAQRPVLGATQRKHGGMPFKVTAVGEDCREECDPKVSKIVQQEPAPRKDDVEILKNQDSADQQVQVPGKDGFEDYIVRGVVMDLLVKFADAGSPRQWIDAFASPETTRFGRFWVEAESQDWDLAGRLGFTLWLNPPFSKWPSLISRVLGCEARCVCMIPDWGQEYILQLLEVAATKGYIPSGSPIFERFGAGRCAPTRWGLWILVICAIRKKVPREEWFSSTTILPYNRAGSLLTTARKRRLRRQTLEKARSSHGSQEE